MNTWRHDKTTTITTYFGVQKQGFVWDFCLFFYYIKYMNVLLQNFSNLKTKWKKKNPLARSAFLFSGKGLHRGWHVSIYPHCFSCPIKEGGLLYFKFPLSHGVKARLVRENKQQLTCACVCVCVCSGPGSEVHKSPDPLSGVEADIRELLTVPPMWPLAQCLGQLSSLEKGRKQTKKSVESVCSEETQRGVWQSVNASFAVVFNL